MKRSPLRKISPKRKQKLAKVKEDSAAMWKYLEDWFLSLPPGARKCQSCGKQLHAPPATYNFDHLIEKSKRPDLAMVKDNIFLCCFDCHALKTNGYPTKKHKEAIRKAEEIFGSR